MKKVLIGLSLVILLVLISLGFVIAEESITCNSNSDCGEVSTSFAFCKNETTICTTTTTPTCKNASTNTSSCKDIKEDSCWVCKNGCEKRACVSEVSSGNGNGNENSGNNNKIDDDNESGENFGLGQMIRNRVQAGVYTAEDGQQIRVRELAQNRYEFMIGNYSFECNQCNMTQEQVQNKTRLRINFSNGNGAEIKIMPNVASEKALERLRLRNCNSDNNCSIELKEVGNKEQTRAAYEIQAERHARIFGLFKAKMQARVQVDAENGEVIQIKKPWWAFLASEPEE